MAIFKKLFTDGSKNQGVPEETIAWKELTHADQLDELIGESVNRTQAIFKHSTRCGISRSVLKQFERQSDQGQLDYHFLDLLKYRDLSDEISKRFNIEHQSPQLIIINEGKAKAHESHYDIMGLELKTF